jgi:hypothetical protein
MEWDLGVPLLVVLATLLVGMMIFFAAKSLMFKGRVDEGIDPPPGTGGGHRH